MWLGWPGRAGRPSLPGEECLGFFTVIEVFEGHGAVRLFGNEAHFLFRRLQLLPAVAGQSHALLVAGEHFVERKFVILEFGHDGVEALHGVLEILRGFVFFAGGHAGYGRLLQRSRLE